MVVSVHWRAQKQLLLLLCVNDDNDDDDVCMTHMREKKKRRRGESDLAHTRTYNCKTPETSTKIQILCFTDLIKMLSHSLSLSHFAPPSLSMQINTLII